MRALNLSKKKQSCDFENAIPTKEPRRIDLLSAIEQIVERSAPNGLCDEFFVEAKRYISYVARRMKLTTMQAVLFALFIDRSEDSSIRLSEISQTIKCRTVKLIRYMNDVDELERRHLVKCSRCRYSDSLSYSVPVGVIEALKRNEVYEYKVPENVSADELFVHLNELFDQREENAITYDGLLSEIKLLLDANTHLSFVRKVRDLKFVDESLVLFLLFCNKYVQNNDDDIRFSDFDDLYEHKCDFVRAKRELYSEMHEMQVAGLIEYNQNDGFVDRESFRLKMSTKEDYLSEVSISIESGAKDKRLVKSDNIVEKKLYYNEREQQQVDELSALLSQQRFSEVSARLKENGMRQGFACLFYGVPGTGKTETALQLARMTGRDILQVDFSQLKSCWVGESEKNVKLLFDSYRSMVSHMPVTPILLFNEADAIIGKRMEGVTKAVDKMENSIQNIILQEMETLDGIMIATTNLTGNLDHAFERRFLYKIEFGKPSIDAKSSIWQSLIPHLSAEEAKELSAKYDFSGGQIENIARKSMVDCILTGRDKSDMVVLHRYCESELITHLNKGNRVGF